MSELTPAQRIAFFEARLKDEQNPFAHSFDNEEVGVMLDRCRKLGRIAEAARKEAHHHDGSYKGDSCTVCVALREAGYAD